jgi:hypothetical protein
VKFGMEPQEGAILDGKAVVLPVALRTVELSAKPDGTITHRAEFLDTEAGQVAAQLYASPRPAASPAPSTPMPRTNPAIARGFHGFDYVLEPNYSTNRGHRVLLDSANPEVAAMLDGLLDQAAREQDELVTMFDGLHTQHLEALTALEHAAQQNEELLDLVVKLSGKDRKAVLDSVGSLEHVTPEMLLPADPSMWTKYRDVELARVAELPKERHAESAETRYAQQRYGRAV